MFYLLLTDGVTVNFFTQAQSSKVSLWFTSILYLLLTDQVTVNFFKQARSSKVGLEFSSVLHSLSPHRSVHSVNLLTRTKAPKSV